MRKRHVVGLAIGGFIIWTGISGAIKDREARSAGFKNAADHAEAVRAGLPDQAAVDAAKAERARLAGVEKAERERVASLEREETARVKAAEDAYYAPGATQQAFLTTLDNARTKFRNATNDLAKGAVRTERGKAVCKTVPADVKDWSGTITNLSSNSDGLGVLEVKVGENVTFKTWNNALSDSFHDTLIPPGSNLSGALSELQEGQRVRFSGKLFRDRSSPDCYYEGSLGLDGSMRDPEYIMRFSSVTVMP